jgi:hypothetical protein
MGASGCSERPFRRWGCRCSAVAVGIALLAAPLPMPVAAEPDDACRQNEDLVRKQQACTGLLTVLDGTIGPNAWALVERANAWCWSGDAEQAVADIWAWFEEDRAAIRLMQEKLAVLGFYDGPANGGYSLALDNAVIAWAEAGCPEAR